MATRRILFSWIGHNDLRALAASLPEAQQEGVLNGLNLPKPLLGQVGPLKCLLDAEQFDEVHLLSDHGNARNRLYLDWLGGGPVVHAVKLKNPTDYPDKSTRILSEANRDISTKQFLPPPWHLCETIPGPEMFDSYFTLCNKLQS